MKLLFQMNRGKLSLLLDIGIIAFILFLAFSQQPSLMDYEKRCRETPDSTEKEKIALQAVEFLVRQSVPDSIVQQVNQAVVNENLSSSTDSVLFLEIPAIMSDSLAGFHEAFLRDHLPQLYYARRMAKNGVVNENWVAARRIAEKLDAWAKYDYWAPLMDFLENARDEVWHRWRAAVIAAKMSRGATRDTQFARAKFFAVYGLQGLAEMPDRRLYLDLCFRLQNAIAEGDAVFNLGFALGNWITRESLAAKYYLRAAGAECNIANQFVLTGRFDEALEKLKEVRQLIQQRQHVKLINYYEDLCHERMSAAAYQKGDLNSMIYYLNLTRTPNTSTRQKVLGHIRQGQTAKYRGEFETAEKEFEQAIAYGKGNENHEPDPANVFYAHLNLGVLYSEYNMPERALLYYNRARQYAENEGFLNAERWSDYWLHCAQAYIQRGDMTSAKTALDHATKQFIDSPHLRIKNLFTAATIYENLEEFEKAHETLNQVRQICIHSGQVLQEINAILRQAALSLNIQKGPVPSDYPVEELEEVIARVQKTGNKRQLVNALALIVDAASNVGRYEYANHYANLLLEETEALSRMNDEEQRLIFFQHSIYESVKAPIRLDIRFGRVDSAFAKLNYVKARALRQRLAGMTMPTDVMPDWRHVEIARLQKQLSPDEAIIDYMVAEDTLYTFALTRYQLRIFRSAVFKPQLQAEVDEYMNHLTSDERKKKGYNEQRLRQDFGETVELSHRLYDKLMGGMDKFLERVNRLYIVPDEFLHALPFNTLVVRKDSDPDFLISHKALMYLPAASMFSKSMEDLRTTDHLRGLASIDPQMYGARTIHDSLIALFGENVSITTAWEKSSLAGGYGLYFFYAHAKADWDDPWQSLIQFPLKHPTQRGELHYADVDSIDWHRAALVILAGCETTGSRIYSGAGLSGLQRSFLASGAKQVLATFWRVDAAHVALQMSDFLANWDHYGDAMLALQMMQQQSIDKLKRDAYLKYPHPRFWGAYNLTGIAVPSSAVYQYAGRVLQ
jgi:CHAT domain-containing protein